MLCCPVCFDDTVLEERIRRSQSSKGRCDYCRSTDQPLVEPRILQDDFEAVLGAYHEVAEGGQPFAKLIMEEWGLFPKLDPHPLRSLLDDILGEGFHTRQFSSAHTLDRSKALQWDRFREEIKHQNRFFPSELFDLTDLKDLLDHLKVQLEPGEYYRARVQREAQYPSTQMGKPPGSLCDGGRANPMGISYFYIASDPSTALAEVRPHPGDKVTIAKFWLENSLVVLDLQNPRKTISPFGRDQDQLVRLRSDMEFLQQLSDGLSMPIQPRVAHLEYLPSQYLCEFIKKIRYQGVVYRSAVSTGTNYALFDDIHFQCISIYSLGVLRIKVETSEIIIQKGH